MTRSPSAIAARDDPDVTFEPIGADVFERGLVVGADGDHEEAGIVALHGGGGYAKRLLARRS